MNIYIANLVLRKRSELGKWDAQIRTLALGYCGHNIRETPGPIPNSAVKPTHVVSCTEPTLQVPFFYEKLKFDFMICSGAERLLLGRFAARDGMFTRRNTPASAQGSPGTSPGRTSVQGNRDGRHRQHQSRAVYTPGPGQGMLAPLKAAARRSDGGMVHSSGLVLRADVSRYFRYRSPGIPGGCRRYPRAAVMVPSGLRRGTS